MAKKSAVTTALRIARRARKADGGELDSPDSVQFNRPFGEISAGPAPSPTQRIGNAFQDAMEYIGARPDVARHLRQGVGGILGMSPMGIAGSAADAVYANATGDKMGAVQGMAGMIPGVGPIERATAGEAAPALRMAIDSRRNQFTGQFKKVGESPLPGNAYRSVNTQAKPVAANSGQVVSDFERTRWAPQEVDPALLRENLSKMDNPMAQYTPPSHPDFDPAAEINPHDVSYWTSRLPNSFGHKHGGAIRSAIRVYKADGGPVHEGYIPGDTGGRTDNKDISVGSGAYVIPADILSGLGEGNSQAGWAALAREYGLDQPRKAAGGPISGAPMGAPPVATDAVPIVAASGEAVIPPDAIIAKHGDLDTGHKVLDAVVKHVRAKTVKKLKSLPGPKKN